MFVDCETVLERGSMVVMSNRPRRSLRTLSVTSPGVRSLLTCGFTLAALTVATLNTPVASADPSCTAQQRADYPGLCGVIESTVTPAPSSGGSSGGGFSAWFSSFFDDWGGLLFVGGIAAVITWVVIASRRDTAEEKQKKAAAQAAHGRALAERWHAEQVQRAHAEAAAQMPPREVYDPMNMGVAPVPVEVDPVPAPPTDPDDLKRYSVFNGVNAWTPGTAFAAVVARNGDWSRARNAWALACEQAGLGEVDESGVSFTPAATLDGLRTIGGDDDAVILAIRPAGLHIAEKALDRVREFLVVTAHVETASPFQREAATGLYLTTLRNRVEAPAPAPEAAPVSDVSRWEW